jgi:hypothetical protein
VSSFDSSFSAPPFLSLSHRFQFLLSTNARQKRRHSLRLTQFIETSRCRTHVRSTLRTSGAALVLVPSSSALAAVAPGAVASDDGESDNQNSVVLLGLAAAVASEGLSAVPWARSAFDDTKASAALHLAAGGWESKAAVEKAKYLSLGAAGAFVFVFGVFRGPGTETNPAKERETRRRKEAEKEREKGRKNCFRFFGLPNPKKS